MPRWGPPHRHGQRPGHQPGRPFGQGSGCGRSHLHTHRHHYRRRWGLRRRLNFTFAFVALAAVGLTTWLTLGAVFRAQSDLFDVGGSAHSDGTRRGDADDGPPFGPWGAERDAFRGVARTSLLAGLLSFVLATVVSGAVTRRLTRPLLALEAGARRLEAGERDVKLPLPAGRDELRSLTAAFNSLVEGLERQEGWRRGMVADIAHDLRTPLAVMRSELEAMQDGLRALDDAGLARLHNEVMTLSHLVDDLRTLSVAEGGGLEIRPLTVEVEPFLTRLVESFRDRAAEAGVTLTVGEVPSGLEARFDPDRIGRVLSNLIDNALRHGSRGSFAKTEPAEPAAASGHRQPTERAEPTEPSGPMAAAARTAEVTVSASAAGETLLLQVSDNGPGLPAGAEKRIFERFYRADLARGREGEVGSGLGLSIARALTEAHGGTLEAANRPAGGAVFTVSLSRAVSGRPQSDR